MKGRNRLGVLLSVLALGQFGFVPNTKSGFYCDDPKISFKYTGDTITMAVLLSITLTAPFLSLWVVESCCFSADDYDVPKSAKQRSVRGARQALFWYWEFLVGLVITLLVTEVGKHLVGEPRPDFLDLCRPDVAVNCTVGKYMPTFTCTNTQGSKWLVRDSTKSFPSGHASLSVYAAMFMMWFIQRRVPGDITYLLVPWLQCMCLIWALTCSLTRITDHRHHWWDVLAGSVVGAIAAVFTVRIFCRGFFPDQCLARRPSKLDAVSRENGHVVSSSNGDARHQSVRRLLSSTSSSGTPEDRELRDVTLS